MIYRDDLIADTEVPNVHRDDIVAATGVPNVYLNDIVATEVPKCTVMTS